MVIAQGRRHVPGYRVQPFARRNSLEYTARDAEIEDDALKQLEQLAAQERRRNPSLSKAQSFTKVYVDPANIALVKRERAQNRPRVG
jgi:hypothetical protein